MKPLSRARSSAFFSLALGVIAPVHAGTSNAVLEVTGGAHAGRHSISAANQCLLADKPPAGKPRKFEVNIGSQAKDPKALTLVSVLLRRLDGPAPVAADQLIQIQFGPLGGKGVFYQAGFNSTTGRTGTPATVTFKDGGAKASATFEFESDGVKLKGTIDCDLMRY
ncbi:hypothetical protein BH09PSE6_BH09PSE6_06860 [soil metagenome]